MVLNDVIIGVLFTLLGVSLLSIFRYWVTNRVESKQWEREQRAQEIERIDTAASDVSQHAAILMNYGYSGTPIFNQAISDLRAGFARWDMLLNPYCTEEEREKIQNQWDILHASSESNAVAVNTTVIEITHAVKDRLISDAEKRWWKFRK